MWLRKLLSDLFDLHLDATCIYYDNQSCVKLSENPVLHDKSKHIEIEYRYIEEYQSIMKNDVWDVVPRPEGKSIVTSKWVYKIKHAVDGSIEKYKSRFMAHGFS